MSKKHKHDRNAEMPETTSQAGEAQARVPSGAEGEPSVTDERDDLLARLQRVSADYLNYQKRVQRDIEQAREYANEGLIKAFLDVLDDMERSLEAARANHHEDDALLQGMQLVHDKALEILGKFGVKRIQAEGEPFDPELHSALMQQETDEVPPQTVLQEVQRGYQLKGRTIRPSNVIVSKPVEDEPQE